MVGGSLMDGGVVRWFLYRKRHLVGLYGRLKAWNLISFHFTSLHFTLRPAQNVTSTDQPYMIPYTPYPSTKSDLMA